MSSPSLDRLSFFVALAALPASSGCTWLGTLEAGGVTSPTGREGRSGVAVEARGAFGDDHVLTGVGMNAKVTRDVVSVGPAVEMTFLFAERSSPVEPFVTAGVTPVGFGSADGRFTTSVLSPRMRGGAYFPFGSMNVGGRTLRGPTAIVVSGFAEYDLRASGPKSEAFVGGTVGFGYFFQIF